jgi:hypothetical protein
VRRASVSLVERPEPTAPSRSLVRRLGALAVVAVVVHAAGRLWLLSEGRYFATEGTGAVVGRFWLPGQFFVLGALGRLGLDAASAPLVLGAITFGVTLVAVHALARDLAPEGWGEAAGRGAVVVAATSPLLLVLSHSALAEPLSNALVAFAASALVRRHRVGPRRLVFSGAVAMLLATWVRYEAWGSALVFVVAAAALAHRREGRAAALREGAVASLAWLGPSGWLVAQYVVHDDPLAFLGTIEEMSIALAGRASPASVAAQRVEASLVWAGAAVASSVAAIILSRRAPRSITGLLVLAGVGVPSVLAEVLSGRGLGVFVVDDRTFDFFSPRLVSHVEVGLFPLAGLGLARLLASQGSGARLASAALVVLGGSLLVRGLAQPMSFVDPSSVAAGVALRRGELDDRLGGGALLVERVEPRPPMGWASLSVLWSRWDRTIFFTRRGAQCDLVEAQDVRTGRARIPCADLDDWASSRGVGAVWVTSAPARAMVEETWPHAARHEIGDGLLLSIRAR